MTSLLQRVLDQPHVLLLSDFDGTLSEIVATPEAAALLPGNADLLRHLSKTPGYTAGVLSGRALHDVCRRVGVDGLVYAGNHGLEISAPGIEYLHPGAQTLIPDIAAAAARLSAALAHIPGAFVENKTFTLTTHYRQSAESCHRQVMELFEQAASPLIDANLCQVTTAKAALELRPAIDWNKGKALEYIRRRICPDAFPLYIGDDATDEDAFEVAQNFGGAGVFVGPPNTPTRAQFRLDSPQVVQDFLSRLASRQGD